MNGQFKIKLIKKDIIIQTEKWPIDHVSLVDIMRAQQVAYNAINYSIGELIKRTK